MDDSQGGPKPRRVLIEMSGSAAVFPENRPRHHNRGNRNNNWYRDDRPHDEPQGDTSKTIEMQPVIRAAQEFGRRAHSLGALQGAYAVEELITQIKGLGPTSEELKRVLEAGEKSAEQLRSYLHSVYKD
jgi:hypothetical protein